MNSIFYMMGLAVIISACGGSAEPYFEFPETVTDAGSSVSADGGDIDNTTMCCQLNKEGQRLDYKCGTALNQSWFETRGYRCWTI